MGRTGQKGGSRIATGEREITVEVRGTRLERKASGPLLDELVRMEANLHRRYQDHLARTTPRSSIEKDRILAVLRSKN